MSSGCVGRQRKRLYDPATANPAFHLRYTWTGWPSRGIFKQTAVELLQNVMPLWESDGMRLLEHNWTSQSVQLVFSAKPFVSPRLVASRAKGRLDHAMRNAGLQMPLSRKLAVRTVGDNVTKEVETYIENQVGKERLVDPRFEAFMKEFTVINHDVDLSRASETARGRYWYNLHIVLVTAERYRIVDRTRLATLRDWSMRVSREKGHLISRLSVLPDHLHLALRGDPSQSPNDIVGAYQNNLAYALGQQPVWNDSFYAGTFSDYNMEAIRRNVARSKNRRCPAASN